MGDTSHTLGTVLRIVAGALIGLAALPVVFTLLRTRRPEFGTPQLALTLRTWSIVLHVLAGVLIIGTAISEIWLSLDAAGPWLFGIYGAAAAIALLGMFAFYLAYVAELPPPPPKPLKPKTEKQRRGRRGKAGEEADADESSDAEAEAARMTPRGGHHRRRTSRTSQLTIQRRAAGGRGHCRGRRARRPWPKPRPTSPSRHRRTSLQTTTRRHRDDQRQAAQSAAVGKDEPTRRRRRRLRGGVAVED